ncbi:MAG TPA: hypothetical protein VFB21_19020, partial [Chthonomonadaceae bacterium]|nr:hypothetical protein [Chthonomonadaceae bacterium]
MRWKQWWEQACAWAMPPEARDTATLSQARSAAERDRLRRSRLLAAFLVAGIPLSVLLQSSYLLLFPVTATLLNLGLAACVIGG